MFPCPTFKVLSLMVLFYLCIGRTYLLVFKYIFCRTVHTLVPCREL